MTTKSVLDINIIILSLNKAIAESLLGHEDGCQYNDKRHTKHSQKFQYSYDYSNQLIMIMVHLGKIPHQQINVAAKWCTYNAGCLVCILEEYTI